MPRLAIARPEQVRSIYQESHALWGASLTVEDYAGLWDDVSRTAWARTHACFFVWEDDRGRVLSSMKLYRPLLKIGEFTARSAVLGAIFTPRRHRGARYARALVAEVLEREKKSGAAACLLFSDIGTRYYTSLGFHALPAEEQWGSLRRLRGSIPPGWEIRRATGRDAPALLDAQLRFANRRPLAVIRDADHWEFIRTRSGSFFARLGDAGIRHTCRVVENDGSFVGYLVTVEGRGEWNVREVGASDGDAATMATILRLGARQARRSGLRRIYGWLPPDVVRHLVDWRLSRQARRRAVPMIAPFDRTIDLHRLASAEDAYIPFQDQF